MSTKDDVWEGYFIPKGSSIFVNSGYVNSASFGLTNYITAHTFCPHRFILRDPRVWDDADTFRPERLLGKERPPFDPLSVVFGFGRRLVPIYDPPGINDPPH